MTELELTEKNPIKRKDSNVSKSDSTESSKSPKEDSSSVEVSDVVKGNSISGILDFGEKKDQKSELETMFDDFHGALLHDWKRKLLRVGFATCLVLTVGLAVGLAQINLSRRETFTFTPGPEVTIMGDSCDLTIHEESRTNYRFEIELTDDSNVHVSFDDSTFILNIENRRGIANRYAGYFCRILLIVPEGVPIVPLNIIAAGSRQSTFNTVGHVFERISLSSTGTQFFVNLNSAEIMDLQSTFDKGDFRIDNSTVNSATIFTTGVSIIWSFLNSVEFTTTAPLANICLSGYNLTCNTPTNMTTTGCTSIFVSSTPNNSSSTISPIFIDCPNCFINLIVANDNGMGSLETFGVSEPRNIAFDNESVSRLNRVFFDSPVPQFVSMEINGQGVPGNGRWIWSTRFLYIIYPISYLDVVSFFLISPRTRSLNVTLSPGFCPPVRTSDPVLENLVPIDQLLRTTIVPNPNPDSLFAFQKRNSDLSTSEYMVFQDRISGENRVNQPSFSSTPRLTVILVVNLVLVLLSTSYAFYVFLVKGRKWGRGRLDLWGQIYYGKDWEFRKEEFYNRSGPIFLSEFLIGFPRENRVWWKTLLTVLLHFVIILLITGPLLALAGTLSISVSRRFDEDGIPAFSLFLYIASVAYVVFSLIYLILYYLRVNWKILKWIGWPFFIASGAYFYLSLFYMTYVAFWVLLGALISPNDVLPYASVIIVLLGHTILTGRRLIDLSSKLNIQVEHEKGKSNEEDLSNNQVKSQVSSTSSNIQVKSQLNSTQLAGIVSNNTLLELRDQSLRSAIVTEIVTFLILVLFFIFMLTAFTTLSSSTETAAAISGILPFLLVGGLNFNLNPEIQTKEKFQANIQKAKNQNVNTNTKETQESKKLV